MRIKTIIILVIPLVISVTSVNAREISNTFSSTANIRFTETRRTLLNSVLTLNVNFNQLNPQNKIQLLLYGDTSFSDAINKLLLISTLKFSVRLNVFNNLQLLNWLKIVRTSFPPSPFCVLCWQQG